MTAIIGSILDEPWTEPAIVALLVTTDGFVMTHAEFFGGASDLDRNLLIAANLTPEERAEFERRTKRAARVSSRHHEGSHDRDLGFASSWSYYGSCVLQWPRCRRASPSMGPAPICASASSIIRASSRGGSAARSTRRVKST